MLGGVPTSARKRHGLHARGQAHDPRAQHRGELCLPAWAAGTAGYERLKRIYEMIPEVEVLKDRKGLQLSGGQQKLAALARSLM